MKQYQGLAASPGIAIGPAFIYLPQEKVPQSAPLMPADSATEVARLEGALDVAHQQLAEIYARSVQEMGEGAAEIFLAHQEFLEDPVLLDEVKNQILGEHHLSAEAAVQAAFEDHARQLEALEDTYYQERALDLRDVSRRVCRILAGLQDQQTLTNLASPVIIVARDLTPSDTAQMNKAMVLGFCTASGGLTSHTAIIARILGIPAVVGIGETVLEVPRGASLIVDGDGGRILADADEATMAEYAGRRDSQVARRTAQKARAHKPAATKDGHRVEIVANIADATSAQAALDFGAEGVGLFRTEYLFLNRQSMPTEEEQYHDYCAVAEVLGNRPLIIRTLDIGGDKQLPYLDVGDEMNPFLGWRAIRLCLDSPQIFEPQLRAILRASAGRNVQIMFPMIATLAEVRRARGVVRRVQEQLATEGVAFDAATPIGIMVEIPSAALMADLIAPEVDFFSIGTNDLIQYTMACDRVNEKVAYLYDPLHPAVLRLIHQVIAAAHNAGRWVGMCGEMASDLEAIPLLLGLGLDEFSMNASVIPVAKELLASLTLSEAQRIAQEALAKSSAVDIRAYLRSLDLLRGQ
jgi:phosphoenolpyruvate-protein phosphotransferase